jgi:hypothetical protein
MVNHVHSGPATINHVDDETWLTMVDHEPRLTTVNHVHQGGE